MLVCQTMSEFDPRTFSLEPWARRIEKPWGYEILLSPPDAPYTSKLIHVRAGKRLSLQLHDVKVETQTLIAGRGGPKASTVRPARRGRDHLRSIHARGRRDAAPARRLRPTRRDRGAPPSR